MIDNIMYLEIIFVFRIWGNSQKVYGLSFQRKLNIYFGFIIILLVQVSLFIRMEKAMAIASKLDH